jgi:hypothetical protein
MIEDLVEAISPLFKVGGGFTEILYLLLLLAVLAFLVLELLFEEGIRGQRFLELLMQPLHRYSVALIHPLECGLQLGSICMAEIIAEYWSASAKVLKLVKGKRKLPLILSCCCKSATSMLFSTSSFSCELTTWTRSSTTFL